MKRFLFLSVIVFIVIMAIVSLYEHEDDKTVPQKLERAMRLTQMMEYSDDDYDYDTGGQARCKVYWVGVGGG